MLRHLDRLAVDEARSARWAQPGSVGNRLNFKKSDYPTAYREKFQNDYYPSKEWNEPDMPMLIAYCKQDTRVTARLLKHLEKQLSSQKFVGECIELEHQVAEIIAEQVRNGVLIDQKPLLLCMRRYRMR